ncbi:MAG TPA: FG-GAP repeat protein, partial [Kofleriaceae bacterium]|nr:FG-GAP repeat protein [Kofleriaceae bacterium]
RTGTTWTQQAYLKASNTGKNDNFGTSVALAGDLLAVGANFEASAATGVNPASGQVDNSAGGAGTVYVFVRTDTTWTQQAYLKASNTGSSDQFGISVALSEDTLAVGAWGESSGATGVNPANGQADNSATKAGVVYVFR